MPATATVIVPSSTSHSIGSWMVGAAGTGIIGRTSCSRRAGSWLRLSLAPFRSLPCRRGGGGQGGGGLRDGSSPRGSTGPVDGSSRSSLSAARPLLLARRATFSTPVPVWRGRRIHRRRARIPLLAASTCQSLGDSSLAAYWSLSSSTSSMTGNVPDTEATEYVAPGNSLSSFPPVVRSTRSFSRDRLSSRSAFLLAISANRALSLSSASLRAPLSEPLSPSLYAPSPL